MPATEFQKLTRGLLKISIALFLFFANLSCKTSGTTQPTSNLISPSPTHIILFIGDGTQLEHLVALSRYLYGIDFNLIWDDFPYQSYASTWDVSSYNAYAPFFSEPPFNDLDYSPKVGYDPDRGGVAPFPIDRTGDSTYLRAAATDSASSATAMATGSKTDSGNISWLRSDPANGEIESISEKMRRLKGASIGVISTVPFNHATPAAFVSHNTNRGNYGEIADEIIFGTKPEVVIGGGHPAWTGGFVSANQLDNLRNSTEYVLVEREAAVDGGARLIEAANALPANKKLFGLFGGASGNFDPPVPSDTPGAPGFAVNEENPSLAEAVEAGLTVLSRDPHGFFLMAEAGDIDWANHANNYSWMIGAAWQLEEAVRAAVNFVNRPDDNVTWDNTLLIVTADHGNSYMRLTDAPMLGAGDLPTQIGASYPDGEVTYGSGGHTNELVMVYAIGGPAYHLDMFEGLWYPGTQIIDNTHIYWVMAKASGVY